MKYTLRQMSKFNLIRDHQALILVIYYQELIQLPRFKIII